MTPSEIRSTAPLTLPGECAKANPLRRGDEFSCIGVQDVVANSAAEDLRNWLKDKLHEHRQRTLKRGMTRKEQLLQVTR